MIPIDTATNRAGPPIGETGRPAGIAITPDGKTAYVAAGDTVIPVDTATDTPGTAIHVGSGADAVAITPDGKTVYVATVSGVIPVDAATGRPGPAIHTGQPPDAIAITPDGKTAYADSESSGTVTAINTATNTPIKIVTVGTPARIMGRNAGSRCPGGPAADDDGIRIVPPGGPVPQQLS